MAAAAVPERLVTDAALTTPPVTPSSVFRLAAVADALVSVRSTLAPVSSWAWSSVALMRSATEPTMDVTAVAFTTPEVPASRLFRSEAATPDAASRVMPYVPEIESVAPEATTDWMFGIVPVRFVTPVAFTRTDVLPSRLSRSAAFAVPVTVTAKALIVESELSVFSAAIPLSEMVAVTTPVVAPDSAFACATVTEPTFTVRIASAAVSRATWSSVASTRSAALPVMVATAVALTGAVVAASIAFRSAAAAEAPVTVMDVRSAAPRTLEPRERRSVAEPERFAGPVMTPVPFWLSIAEYCATVSEESVISTLTLVRLSTLFTSARPKFVMRPANESRTTRVVAPVMTLAVARTRFSDESVM